MLLTESGIHLPKGAKSAKVLAHKDMDGFMSALLTVNQLDRQGIPKNRINIEWVQYGESDLLDKATKKNKHQTVIAVDFAAFPTVDLERSFNRLTKISGGFKDDFKSDYSKAKGSFPSFLRLVKTKDEFTANWFKDWVKENISAEVDVIVKPKETYEELNNFIKALNSYKDGDDIRKIKIADLDYVSDHHDNTKGNLTAGKKGRIERTQFKSDTEHIATVSAQGLMGWEDLSEISKVDSAGYEDIENTISMSKNLKGRGRKERLAVLLNSLLTSIIKSNEKLASKLVKESAPSLISVYNNAVRLAKLNDNQLKVYSELKKPNPNFEAIEELLKGFTDSEKSKIISREDEGKVKSVSSIDSMRKKNLAFKKAELKKEGGLYKTDGNVIIQRSTNTKNPAPRYLSSMISEEGKSFPFIIKRFGALIQVQVNANIPKEYKNKLDVGTVCEEAVERAQKEFGSFSNKWAWDIIKESSGGHRYGIWNISGLGTLSSTGLNSAEREEARYLGDIKSRADKLKDKEAKKRIVNLKKERIDELDSKKTSGSLLQKSMDFMIDYIVRELNNKFGHVKMAGEREDYELK